MVVFLMHTPAMQNLRASSPPTPFLNMGWFKKTSHTPTHTLVVLFVATEKPEQENPATHPMCVLTSVPKRNKIHYMGKQLEQPSEHLRDTASSNHNYVVSLYQQLVEHRREHGPSTQELAERTGWSVEKLENFECYDASPTLNDIARYATALETRIQDIHKP